MRGARVGLLSGVIGLMLGLPLGALAQPATPTLSDTVPCQVDPLTTAELEARLAAAEAAMPASPEAVSREPADQATIDAIAATLGEITSCGNSFDLPRVAALLSGRVLNELIASGEVAVEDLAVASLPAGTPAPPWSFLENGYRLRILEAWALSDGRVAALVEEATLTGGSVSVSAEVSFPDGTAQATEAEAEATWTIATMNYTFVERDGRLLADAFEVIDEQTVVIEFGADPFAAESTGGSDQATPVSD
jgi:hypothetical protein